MIRKFLALLALLSATLVATQAVAVPPAIQPSAAVSPAYIQQQAVTTRLRRVGCAGDSQGTHLCDFGAQSIWYWAQAYKPRAFLFDGARWNFSYSGSFSGPERAANSSTVVGHAAIDGQDFDTPKVLNAIAAANLDDLWIATCGNDNGAASDPALCYRNVKEAIDYLRANSTIKRFIIFSAVLPKDTPQSYLTYSHGLMRQLAATSSDVFFFEVAQYLVDEGSQFNPPVLSGGIGSPMNDAVGHMGVAGARLLAGPFNTFLDSIGGYPVIQPRAVFQGDYYAATQTSFAGPAGNEYGDTRETIATGTQNGTLMTVSTVSGSNKIMLGSLIVGNNVPTATKVLYDSTNSTTQCGGSACTGAGTTGTYGVSTSTGSSLSIAGAVSHSEVGAFTATERNAAFLSTNASGLTTANVQLATNNSAITVTGSKSTMTINGVAHASLHLVFTAASNLSACGGATATCTVTVTFPGITPGNYSVSGSHIAQFPVQLNAVTNFAGVKTNVQCNDGTNNTIYPTGANSGSVSGVIAGPLTETLLLVTPGFLDFHTVMNSTTTPPSLNQGVTGTCTSSVISSMTFYFSANALAGPLGSADISQVGIWPLPVLPY